MPDYVLYIERFTLSFWMRLHNDTREKLKGGNRSAIKKKKKILFFVTVGCWMSSWINNEFRKTPVEDSYFSVSLCYSYSNPLSHEFNNVREKIYKVIYSNRY